MLNRQNFAILFSTLIVSAFFLLDFSRLVFAQDQNVPVSYTLNNTVNDYALEFETPLSKFYLTFESGVNWDTTSLEITFEDNTSLNLTHIHPDESVFGETQLTELLTSQLFSFDKNISNLTLYSNVSAKLHSIDNQISFSNSVSATDFQPQSIRQRLFTNLGLDIVTREEWGAPTQSLWYPQIAPSISQIVVHHSATNPNTADPAQAIRDIYELHKNRCSDNSGSYDPNNPNCDEPEELWQDIGYNFLIDQNGSIYEGRAGGFGVTAAHAPPNYGTIGISLIGNFESSNPTGAQKESLKLLVARIADLYQLNLNWGTNLVGHRDKNVTLCPGTNFYNQLPSLANETKALQKSNTNLNTVNDYVDQLNLSLTTELQMVGDLAQVSIKTNSISTQDLDYIKSNLDYVDASQSTSFAGSSFVLVDPDYLKVLIRETKLLDANIKIQPIFKYKTTSWDNTDLNRSVPSDYDANTHWNLEMINATEAWKSLGGCASDTLCGGDPNVVVAVIDTGVAHENYDYDAGGSYSLVNFQGFNIEVPLSATPNGTFNEGYDRRYSLSPELNNVNFVDAYDTYQDYICSVRSVTANPCNAAEIEKINHANDDNGHGTFVTTIIAGDTSDASSNKLVGIAHNVSIMPIKPFFPNDSSFCFFSNGTNDPNCTDPYYDYRSVTNSTLITQAVLYAVDNGADVINMSLSGSGFDPDLQDAINYAVQNNVVVVAASGNNGSDVANYFPGGMDNVISVGAVNPDNSRSYYSNYGSKLDLVAPVGESGTEMIASRTFDCYVTDSCSDESSGNLFYGDSNFTSESTPLVGAGTSFAAPQVSAVVALMKSKDSNVPVYKTEQLLKASANDIHTVGADIYTGYGMVNSIKATDYVIDDFEGSSWINSYGKIGDSFNVGDYDGDGADDVAIARMYAEEGNQYSWFLMRSKDTRDGFEPLGLWASNYGRYGDYILSGDFNGDDSYDILLGRSNSNNTIKWFVLLSNNLHDGFEKAGSWNAGYGRINDLFKVGDYDGDGADDVAIGRVYAENNHQYNWFVMRSNDLRNGFEEVGVWINSYGREGDTTYSGDYNGDSASDILINRIENDGVSRWWVLASNDARDAFEKLGKWKEDSTSSEVNFRDGDFDGDGLDDLVEVNYNLDQDTFSFWGSLSTGTVFMDESLWIYSYGKRGDIVFEGNFDDNLSSDLIIGRIREDTGTYDWWVSLSQ